MNISTEKIVSITEANQNFSRVCRLADREGEVYIFKNNKPRYKLCDLEQSAEIEMTESEKIDFIARRILENYRAAFVELAK